MPNLPRSEWYDLTRDMNWDLTYVTEDQAFPPQLSNSFGVPAEDWWEWDEPYKIAYTEYVHNQAGKDQGLFSVNNVISRSSIFENLDPGWKAAILAHYGAIAVAEYQASIGESRMGRFGRAAAWRNMATYGTLDEMRHGQLQTYFPYQALNKEPRLDWAHKAYHTNEWGIIAARHVFDDMFTANDAVSTAIQLTFTFETGFTNLQFLGMAADAMKVGDLDFGALISSIQTDEARHAQQGEPTLKVLMKAGKTDVAQNLLDKMFWRAWKLFSLLTGLSMDYYTPIEHRTHSFKEFMEEFINKQFIDQFRDFAYSERVSVFMGEPTFGAWAKYTGWWLFRKSHFFNAAGRALRNLQMMEVGTGQGRKTVEVEQALLRMRENASRNWVKMVERNGLILGHEGVEAIFALQPEIAFDPSKKLSPLEVQIFDEIANLWPSNYVEFKREARPIVMETLRQAANGVGARAVDLTDVYGAETGDIYTDYCHLTPRGNEVLAGALKAEVLAALERRREHTSPAAAE